MRHSLFGVESWKNQVAFIESGLRCGLRQLDQFDRDRIDEEVRQILSAKGDGRASQEAEAVVAG